MDRSLPQHAPPDVEVLHESQDDESAEQKDIDSCESGKDQLLHMMEPLVPRPELEPEVVEEEVREELSVPQPQELLPEQLGHRPVVLPGP